MEEQITHIRKRQVSNHSTESIYEVLLDSGDTLSVPTLLDYLSWGFCYYFIDASNRPVQIEACHPIYKDSFIQSKNVNTIQDHLLLLPSF
ncbi:hypothetical protein I6N95_14195 [Vagococcus sp. BWB3-3]|uniref:DUF3892 domain-containing protein n=1 Tax=Vagococcus allomyrinae TaxID=2794353 RepID=A0A940PCR9_9ENTE|nr:hypothetical protein [Vagococcus allomyrinae]MBP1042167.1 hypothetical protein [Vagococcus allomyrinae]